MLSSELLGYPSDARVLIINTDDFGMYPAVNSAVVESIENGIAGSCSLMPPCPGAGQALELQLELRSQIEAVLSTGVSPTHLDWHCLADGGRNDIFDLGTALAEEYRQSEWVSTPGPVTRRLAASMMGGRSVALILTSSSHQKPERGS